MRGGWLIGGSAAVLAGALAYAWWPEAGQLTQPTTVDEAPPTPGPAAGAPLERPVARPQTDGAHVVPRAVEPGTVGTSATPVDQDPDEPNYPLTALERFPLQDAFDAHGEVLRTCALEVLQKAKPAPPRLTMRFVVSEIEERRRAKVQRVEVEAEEPAKSIIEACALTAVERLRFPVPRDGELRYRYPLRLSTDRRPIIRVPEDEPEIEAGR